MPFFYVQDERYNAVAWMPKSVSVQDERYNAMAWMPKSVSVQDERYNAMAWRDFCSRQITSTHIHVSKAKERICSG